nr:PPE family protein [Mycobacterium spongiae]
MVLDYAGLPPEINSMRIFSGPGSGPMLTAATAWDAVGSDLRATALSFDSVVSELTSGPWTGAASRTMAAAAIPYVEWLSAAALRAEVSANQARAAATVFESAMGATVHPTMVEANRALLVSLVMTNIIGQNTPAIAAAESEYEGMWAQDVGAMAEYQLGSEFVVSTLMPFSSPPSELAGSSSQFAAVGSAAAESAGPSAELAAAGPASNVLTAASVVSSIVPLNAAAPVAKFAMMPAQMMMKAGKAPGAGQLSNSMKELGSKAATIINGGGRLGGGLSAGLGQARSIAGMSVPPAWMGTMPAAVTGLGAATSVEGAASHVPMVPMVPAGMGGGAGVASAVISRGSFAQMAQSRMRVLPRVGV